MPASRAQRRAQEQRWRRGEALLTVVVILTVGSYAWVQAGNSDLSALSPSPSAASPSPTVAGEPSQFLAISVMGAAQPLMAVVGTGSGGRKPAALVVPISLTMVMPGAGEMRAKDVSQLPGRSMRVALSNLVGQWAVHYLVTDIDLLASLVDRTGGLNANLERIIVIDTAGLGPGPVTLDGAQVKAMLSLPGADAEAAWGAVLTALLAHPPALERRDVDATDGLAQVQTFLMQAAGAHAVTMPATTVAGSTTVAAQPDLDALMGQTFGTAAPTPVIVQNGDGFAGVGEAVARRILPAGFRVVVSENAPRLDHSFTSIVANGAENVAAARRLRVALKVGHVRLSRVPSGIGDITMVVGRDFKA